MKLDSIVGLGMFAIASIVFAYYTFWMLALPFIDADSIVQSFFPPREWIIRIPAAILIIGVAIIGTFVGSVILAGQKKKAAKEAAKKSE